MQTGRRSAITSAEALTDSQPAATTANPSWNRLSDRYAYQATAAPTMPMARAFTGRAVTPPAPKSSAMATNGWPR